MKRGAFIFHGPRTGSNLLGGVIRSSMLAAGQPVRDVGEIWGNEHWLTNDLHRYRNRSTVTVSGTEQMLSALLDRVLDGMASGETWPVIRMQATQIIDANRFMALLDRDDLFKVMMMRHDVAEQMASALLSNLTGTWSAVSYQDSVRHGDMITRLTERPIELDAGFVDTVFSNLALQLAWHQTHSHRFDQVTWYEDLVSGRLDLPELGMDSSDLEKARQRGDLPSKLNESALDTISRCVTNFDMVIGRINDLVDLNRELNG